MEEKVISLLRKYKGRECNVIRVSIMGAKNSNHHLVIKIKENDEISVFECPYENLSVVKAFLEKEFPAVQIVE
jgi:hypothetical protein